MKKWWLLSACIICISCGTLPLKQHKHLAKTVVEFGAIGQKNTSLYKTAFQTNAVPVFTKKIRVAAQIIPFTKQRLKKYNKALPYLGKKNTLTLSKKENPVYLKLQITDYVAVVEALNNNSNKNTNSYLQATPNSKLVSSIHTVVDKKTLTAIQQADSYYLKTNKHKKQLLHLYKNGKESTIIDLSSSTIFEYGTSSFCWGDTSNRKIKLKSIVNNSQKCSNNTSTNAQEIKEKRTNGFKF